MFNKMQKEQNLRKDSYSKGFKVKSKSRFNIYQYYKKEYVVEDNREKMMIKIVESSLDNMSINNLFKRKKRGYIYCSLDIKIN